jgi:acyl carrier protein
MSIENRIREFLSQNLTFNGDGFNLSEHASFLQLGVIDSLGVVDLVDFASREFQIEVRPAEVVPANFDSVAALAAYVRRKSGVENGTGGPHVST